MLKIDTKKIKHHLKKKHYRYTLYIGIILGVFFLASSVIAVTLYTVLPDSAIHLIPDAHQPLKEDKILVLSPHPDDETIAVGGYISDARRAGSKVKIALVTDGNKHGWQETRYKEFKNSAKLLGLDESDLTFWNFTEGMNNDREYEGIKKMIIAELKTYQPSVVFAPLVQDAHYDHHLIGKAYLEAFKETGYQGESYGFLVHHRFFPQPKRYATNHNLMPPISYLVLGDGWVKTLLSKEAIDTKNEAVLGYHSQLRIPLLNSLLKSMIRQNEIFVKLN